MWGKLEAEVKVILPIRSTPTRVGKTRCAFWGRLEFQVHPHACGENDPGASITDDNNGPPPRVWGKLLIWPNQHRLIRSTPTRVGKTGRSSRRQRNVQVHPHACGENAASLLADKYCRGPPPRVWGKPVIPGHEWQAVRSTPTRVGKTKKFILIVAFASVHPHACGENGILIYLPMNSTGPPPRVWGKLRATGQAIKE